MKIRQKQVAAALAAVEQYLQEEEAAAVAETAAALAPAAGPERIAAVDPGHWAQAGRMEAMGMRRMMQMRAFSRAR